MLGQRGPRRIGAKNITVVVSILAVYAFGSGAWQATSAEGWSTGGRLAYWGAFALLGAGAVWFVYLVGKLISRLFRGPKPPEML